jgi:hypothetical protein
MSSTKNKRTLKLLIFESNVKTFAQINAFEMTQTFSKNPILQETILSWSRHDVGSKLETIGVQMVVVALIYFDLVAYIGLHIMESETFFDGSQHSVETLPNFLSSFLNFTLFGFLLEVMGLIYAFGWQIFSHFGYVLDILVVAMMIYNEMYDWTLFPLRFLVVFRVWRVIRLMNSVVRIVQEKLNSCKRQLSKSRQQIKQFELEISHLEESVKTEMKLRQNAEKRIQSCKDDIDMLNEALRIAAMDVLNLDQKEEVDDSLANIEKRDEEVFYDPTEIHNDSTVEVKHVDTGPLDAIADNNNQNLE